MPLSNSLASRSRALRGAAESGHAHCVLELLPVSDLSSQGPDGLGAVESARRRGHGDVAAMIEAFMEAKDLGSSLPNMTQPSEARLRL